MKDRLKKVWKKAVEFFITSVFPIKLGFVRDKKYLSLLIFTSLLLGVLSVSLGLSIFLAPIISALFFVAISIKIEVKDTAPLPYTIFTVIIWSFVVFWIMQIAISPGIHSIGPLKLILNVVFVSGVVFILASITTSVKVSVCIVTFISMFIAVLDNFVVQTRNMEIQFSDIYSISTAMTVAGGYKYVIMNATLFAFFILAAALIILFKTKFPRVKGWKTRLISSASSFLACLLVVVIVSSSAGVKAIGYIDKYWSFRSSQYNGFYLSLIRSASASKVDEPKGYSTESLQDLLNDYLSTYPPTSVDPEKPADPDKKLPNVIVIMNETFSDLQTVSQSLGKEMPTDVNVLEYYHSLTNDMPNVSKGHALASVYGGNTANSEFEFLTGNTMAFLPLNTVAYNLYLEENNCYSIVDVMNAYGYHTVGMHPAPAMNWQRNHVYEWLGFDTTYFIDDFEDYETYRSETSSGGITLVTDECVYDKIISEYENREEDSPLFTFAVTIQNHGGYSTTGFEPTVNLTDSDLYSGTEEYLSCIKKSDEALKEFLTYFEQQDEDTLVVFYGDHQPSLSNSMYNRYFGLASNASTEDMQAKYVVPYMFWANFEFEDNQKEFTSLNFLAPRVLDIIGLDKSPYMEFLQQLSDNISAINTYGYWTYDEEQAVYNYHPIDMTTMAQDNHLLQMYYWLQYNMLFDEVKLEEWFLPSDSSISEAILPQSLWSRREENE